METVKAVNLMKDRLKIIVTDHKQKIDSIPDYSIFSEDIQKEKRKQYFEDLNKKSVSKIQNLISDIEIKKRELNNGINKIRFPASLDAIAKDDILAIEILKQRAEAIALKKLDHNIIPYLENEFKNNKNIDFINYFQDTVKLNTEISNELRKDLNEFFSTVEAETELKQLKKDTTILNTSKEYLEAHKEIIKEIDSPEKKMSLIYIESELNKLDPELKF